MGTSALLCEAAGVWARAVAALYLRPSAYFALPFLVVFSLHTFTESVALVQNGLIWLMFVAIAVKLALPEPRVWAPGAHHRGPDYSEIGAK